MRRKGRPKKQKTTKAVKVPGKRGRPRKKVEVVENEPPPKKNKRGRPRTIKIEHDAVDSHEDPLKLSKDDSQASVIVPGLPTSPDDTYSEGLHMSTMQVRALSSLIACLDCGEEVILGVRPTTKGMISEFTVSCKVCESQKSTNTPNLIRERKRKREKKGVVLQKNENINYAHVASFLDNGLGYSGLRHYCKYFNARCLNEATFIVYAKQVIADVVAETEDFLQQNARIVRKAFESQLDTDFTLDLTVGYTTTYHQWGSDFCLVAGAVIELQTGLVIDYDVGNMYCHVCKINAKKIVSMSPTEMTEWFNKHQDTCEIREWCDEIDQDSEEGIKEIDPKYLEAFIAKKIWNRSLVKFGFRYTTLIHESDERVHAELLKAAPYGDIPVIIDNITNCFSRRKSEHARTSFQNKLKAKCPRERVQTKDRIMYVYAMSIPEYNKFAIGSNIKLRELVRRMEMEEEEYEYATELTIQASEIIPAIREQEISEEKSAALKEIGDAFELEKDCEMEEQSQDDPDEEEVAVDDEEGEDDDEEEEEEDEDDDEEMQEDELIDSQDIEVLEEEEEEMVESTVKEIPSPKAATTTEERMSPQEVSCSTLQIDAHKMTLKSDSNIQVSKKEYLGSQKAPTLIQARQNLTSLGEPGAESQIKSASESAGPGFSGDKRVGAVSQIKKTALLAGKSPLPDEENLTAAEDKPSTSNTKLIADTRLIEKKSIHVMDKKANLSEEKNIATTSSEDKKIMVMTAKKPATASHSKTANLPLKRTLPVDSHKEGKMDTVMRDTHKISLGMEVRKVISNDKVRLVVVEKQDVKNDQGSRKESQKQDPGHSSSTKSKELAQSRIPAENGMEYVKASQSKPQEVIKPFRVDFDDD